MALPQSAESDLLEVLRTGEAVDLIRESVRTALQELIEAKAAEVIGAGCDERIESRVTERNGARPRTLSTKAGDIDRPAGSSAAPWRTPRRPMPARSTGSTPTGPYIRS